MLRYLAVFLFSLSVLAGQAAKPLVRYDVVLMQADMVLQQRVPSIDAFGDYINGVQATAEKVVATAQGKPASGFIVVALRPGQRSNVWLDFDAPLPPAVEAGLVSQIRSVLPAQVEDGPVMFALSVGLWGGAAPPHRTPVPKAWADAARKAGKDNQPLEDIVTAVWQD